MNFSTVFMHTTEAASIEASNQQLLQALPAAVYICDGTGLITFYNKAASDLWGRYPELKKEYWNGSWKTSLPDGTPLSSEASALAVVIKEEKQVCELEAIIHRADGSSRFVIENAHALYNNQGELTGGLSMITDVTELKLREEQSAYLQAIIESSEDAIISKTLQGIITSWNPGAERLFGYTAEEMKGASISKLIPADRINEESVIIQRIIRGERVEHFDTKRQHKTGRLLDISLTISPIKDRSGKIIGASKIARDITPQMALHHALSESEQRFRNMIMQSSVAMLVLRGPEFIVEMANNAYLEIIDRKQEDFIGKPLLTSMPEIESQGIGDLLTQVLNTGKPFFGNEFSVKLVRNGKLEQTYFNFAYQPSYEMNGAVTGITIIAFDVTSLVRSKQALEESEKQFRNLVMQSPIAMSIFRGPDYIIEMANTEMFKNIWRKEEQGIKGRKALDVFPELKDQKYPWLLKKVFTTGIRHRENASLAYVQGDDGMKKFYLDYEYLPLKEMDGSVSGIMITVNNVTEQVEAIQKLADAETRLRLAAEGTGLATWDLDLKTREIIYSPKLATLFGHDQTKVLTHQEMRDQLHPEDKHAIVEKAFDAALKTSQYSYEARVVWPDQTVRWIRTLGKIYFDHEQQPQRMLGTMRDITKEKISQKEIEESEQRLNLALDAAELGTWELNLKTGKFIYSKRYIQMFGINDEQVDHAELLTYLHPDDIAIRNSSFEGAMRTGLLDYEARLVLPDQSVRWIKAKGKVFYNEQQEAERMLGTIQDITDRKAIEEELEKRVKLRTIELQQVNLKLKHSNQELEQYAYVASHDLQEPLRKIRTYSGLLQQELTGKADVASMNTLGKVINSAERMSALIYDLLNFSRLVKPETSFEATDLNTVLKNVMNDLELVIQQKEAAIQLASLPVIEAIPLQMGQLFYNLINNSLKFSKTGEVPVIKIQAKKVSDDEVLKNKNLNPKLNYVEISIEDNGIGFAQEGSEQIFEVFKRLHSKAAYPGSGIGLALCRKIALNHQGDIHAEGVEQKGALFHLFLPEQQS